jgi:hypothetical protein
MMAATRAAADLAGCRTIDLAVHELLTAARLICTVDRRTARYGQC